MDQIKTQINIIGSVTKENYINFEQIYKTASLLLEQKRVTEFSSYRKSCRNKKDETENAKWSRLNTPYKSESEEERYFERERERWRERLLERENTVRKNPKWLYVFLSLEYLPERFWIWPESAKRRKKWGVV